jgi:hypothetical protein
MHAILACFTHTKDKVKRRICPCCSDADEEGRVWMLRFGHGWKGKKDDVAVFNHNFVSFELCGYSATNLFYLTQTAEG